MYTWITTRSGSSSRLSRSTCSSQIETSSSGSRYDASVARPSGGKSEYLIGRNSGLVASVSAGKIILTLTWTDHQPPCSTQRRPGTESYIRFGGPPSLEYPSESTDLRGRFRPALARRFSPGGCLGVDGGSPASRARRKGRGIEKDRDRENAPQDQSSEYQRAPRDGPITTADNLVFDGCAAHPRVTDEVSRDREKHRHRTQRVHSHPARTESQTH